MNENKIAKAQVAVTYNPMYLKEGVMNGTFSRYRQISPGLSDPSKPLDNYHELIKACRYFYKYNPIAGTVMERMADMAITPLANRRQSTLNNEAVDDVTMAYYDFVAKRLNPVLKLIALEYLIHGMAIPSYTVDKMRGNLLVEKLGRTRLFFPKDIWVRNPETIILKRRPQGMERQVYLKVTQEEIDFIMNEGKRFDGTDDVEGYLELVRLAPDYVKDIKKGKTVFLIEDAHPIMRKPNSYDLYPSPFLTKAIESLEHKGYLKKMDRSIASHVIEAIRIIKVGDENNIPDDDDLIAAKQVIETNRMVGEYVYDLIVPYVYDFSWLTPPIEALLDENKYNEANADIFLAMGFPRVLTTGETLKSNSSDSTIASLGPKATLEDMRSAIIEWVEALYVDLAEKNGFKRIPAPYFPPIITSDYTALVQFAIQALEAKAISRDTVAQLYGTSIEREVAQMDAEKGLGLEDITEMNKPAPTQTTNKPKPPTKKKAEIE